MVILNELVISYDESLLSSECSLHKLIFRAVYIRRKYGNKPLSSSTYLSEAEPFLEQYAKRSPQNQALIGSAGNFVKVEDFMAIVEGEDVEGDLELTKDVAPSSPSISSKDMVAKNEGLIVFFPGKIELVFGYSDCIRYLKSCMFCICN